MAEPLTDFSIIEKKEYNTKRVVIAIAFIAIVISVLLFLLLRTKEESISFFNQPPRDFEPIQTKFAHQTTEGYFTIPLENVTDGRLERVSAQVDYTMKDIERGLDASFKLRGGIHGDVFYNTAIVNEKKKLWISISPKMHPQNYFIEAFIVWDVVDGQPTAYIYADEEWKQHVGDSWILWGREFQKAKKFEWTPVGDGIYMNIIYDEWSRFGPNLEAKEGGIAIANVPTRDAMKDNSNAITVVLK